MKLNKTYISTNDKQTTTNHLGSEVNNWDDGSSRDLELCKLFNFSVIDAN